MPEEGEVVMCKITKIHYNSVFADLNEYLNKSGMIHISEIAPGRIRNIRDYVKEGKMVVCKVLRINHERGHIDLTLRRVTDRQRRNKVNELKREQLAEKILEFAAKKLNKDPKDYFFDVMKRVKDDEYENPYTFFEAIVNETAKFSDANFTKEEEKILLPLIKQRITKPEVEIVERITLSSIESDGVELIRNALVAAGDTYKDNITIVYEGAGRYKITVKASEYKEAEGMLEQAKYELEQKLSNAKHTLGYDRLEA